MYRTVFIDERVEITAEEFSAVKSADNIRALLLSKLKRSEGKCNANGYVKPGSVQIIARSMGVAENGKFTGNWIYDCKFSCEVLKPVAYDPKDPDSLKSSVHSVNILEVNEMGAYGAVDEAIRVLLPRDIHAGIPEFDALKKDAIVRVRMEKHRFQTNDEYIMAIGTLYTETLSAAASGIDLVEPAAAAAAAAAEEEADEEEADEAAETKEP
jgi:hypothetical protein